jgi:DNA polymerase I-like protein with 3'-5' exonuclease and polymerase domains
VRILVNYTPSEKSFLPNLAYLLRQQGITAVSSSIAMTIGELLHKAKLGNCSAILLCNEETLRNCVPGDKPTLDKWRGSRLNFKVPTIVCNSLAHLHTVPYGEWLMIKDLEKFKRIHIPASRFEFTVLDTVDKFEEAYETMAKSLIISADIETATEKVEDPEDGTPVEAGRTWISCSGYTAIMPDLSMRTYVLPLVNFGVDHWETDEEYAQAIMFMQEVNSLPQHKCMHNGMYDATHAIRYHAPYHNYVLDTMALHHAEYVELPKDLAFVASIQLYDYVYWKDQSDAAAKKKDIREYWGYNGKDTWHTARILLSQLRSLPAYARRNFASKFKLVYPSLYCNFEGFRIDPTVRAELRAKSNEQLERARAKLRVMFADPNFNAGSWQQVEKYIYTVFGAKKPRLGKSKSCTDEKNLKAVAEQHPLLALLVQEILDYREAQKAIGTYYDFHQYNGRLMYALNPWGAESERFACSASSLWCGTQVQNIPYYAKSMLVADEGFELVEPDMNKAEARCTAYLAQELSLIAALENAERDFYKQLGTLFFNMPYETVTDFFRNKVLKKINHGTNYMMGPGTFIENIGVKILHDTATQLGYKLVPVPTKGKKEEMTIKNFAKMLLDAYHIPFPRVRMWYKEVYNEVLTTGYLKSQLGHTRRFFGNIARDHSVLRSAVAQGPQNLSVTMMNEGFWKVYKHLVLPSNGEFRLKAQVHDSMPAQYLKSRRDFYVPKMLELMDSSVLVHGRILRVPLDAKVGPSWGELKGYKVPSPSVLANKA